MAVACGVIDVSSLVIPMGCGVIDVSSRVIPMGCGVIDVSSLVISMGCGVIDVSSLIIPITPLPEALGMSAAKGSSLRNAPAVSGPPAGGSTPHA